MDAESEFEAYSRNHRHVLTDWLPPLLDQISVGWADETLVDLGSGDGTMIAGLIGHGRLPARVVAVDLSPVRVEAASALAPQVEGVVADAGDVAVLPDGCADVVISSQVIEHLPDDVALAREVHRLLRPGGRWYISSVLRSPRAWWIYRRDGRAVLDPTHVREYESHGDYLRTLRAGGLTVERLRSQPFRFPISDLVARAAVRAGLVPPTAVSGLYDLPVPGIRQIRRLPLRVPGYRLIEATGRRPA